MKRKELDELKTKSRQQLAKLASDLEEEKANLRVELTKGKLKNVHALSKKAKDIAKVLTILNTKIFSEKVPINAN